MDRVRERGREREEKGHMRKYERKVEREGVEEVAIAMHLKTVRYLLLPNKSHVLNILAVLCCFADALSSSLLDSHHISTHKSLHFLVFHKHDRKASPCSP